MVCPVVSQGSVQEKENGDNCPHELPFVSEELPTLFFKKHITMITKVFCVFWKNKGELKNHTTTIFFWVKIK